MINISRRKSFLSTVIMLITISALFITALSIQNSISETSSNGMAIGREVTFSR